MGGGKARAKVPVSQACAFIKERRAAYTERAKACTRLLQRGGGMRLYEELLARLGPEEDLAFGGAKVVLYAGRCAFFENVKSIRDFSSQGITLQLRRGQVRAEGEKLRIERYGGGDLVLTGKVLRVEVLEEKDT